MRFSLIVREVCKPLILIFGIFIISLLPVFITMNGFAWPGINPFSDMLYAIFHPSTLTYMNSTSGVERTVFPIIFTAFKSSIMVLSMALLFSFVVALVGAIIVYQLPKKVINPIKLMLSCMQSIPDVVYVIFSYMCLIFSYRLTGRNFFNINGAGEEEAIVVPSVVLAILPTIYFFQYMLELIEEEEKTAYFEFAVSKGFKKYYILVKHVIRNMLVRLAHQGKFLFGIMITNLFIVEYLYGNFGLTSFLFAYREPSLFFVSALLFFIPVYLFLKIIQLVIYLTTHQEVEV
ncbi:ABC transporter permease subunit [Paraliobacillus ryukyuensis]|uniref:ABC transporter permease subunit n=1 Tax=Paraliobacillus ryukyuensis TaxID=200904 RepID=UPI0009A70AB1|nr:ABC transporter permease subunit [Paraliobacillus ryukyuensis]